MAGGRCTPAGYRLRFFRTDYAGGARFSVTPYDQIAADFHRRIDCIAGAVDHLAPALEQAAELLARAVLEDRKILVCACGPDTGLGTHLAALLRTGDQGPAMPALALGDATIAGEGTALWRDLRTLSRDGDVLLCLDTNADAPLATQCAEFAHQRNLLAVSLSHGGIATGGLTIPLIAADEELRKELALMAAHSLRNQVWNHLLGD